MKTILLMLVSFVFTQGCAQQKAYDGGVLPDKALAIIYNSEKTEFSDGKIISLMEMVDAIQVGDSWRGWPMMVKVKPGEVNLGLKVKEISFGKSLAKGLLMGVGGAVGGAVAAASDSPDAVLIPLKANVEKGKKYKIVITSKTNSLTDVIFSLQEL